MNAKCDPANINDPQEENGCEIVELGSSKELNNTQKTCKTDSVDDYDANTDIQYKNGPCMTWIYTYHEKKSDVVCVAVPVISGSADINFSLSEDGMKLFITFAWPAPMYSPAVLFDKKLKDNMSLDHPKIHAFASQLLKCGFSDKPKPKGTIVISLPTKVQREVGTWTKEGIKCNDTNVILLEFKAYQKNLIIEDADTSITFS